MKKKNYSVKALVQKAIIDSMDFSKSDGSMIFVYIHPHVDSVSFDAHKIGWTTPASLRISIYLSDDLAPTAKETKEILKPLYKFMNENK